MFKRMKKIYDVEFHEVDNGWDFDKYKIVSNENEIGLITRIPVSDFSLLECISIFNVRWDDDSLGIVIPVGKRAIQRRNIVGTISKVNNNKYFFLLKRTNCYA